MLNQPAEWKWWVRLFAAAAVIGTLMAVASRADEKADPEAAAKAKEALAAFKKTKDGQDPAPRIEAIGRLADAPHTSTVGAVAKYLRDSREGVGPAAAAALGRMGKALGAKERGAAIKALAGGLGVKGKTDATMIASCKALAAMADARAASLLLPVLKDKGPERAQAAVEALGELKSLSAVDGLIGLLQGVEPPAAKGGGNAKAASQTPAQKARTDALHQPCHDALNKITGQSHKTAAEWKKWWKGNKSKLLAEAKRAEAEAKASAKAAAKQAKAPEQQPPVEEDGEDEEGGGR